MAQKEFEGMPERSELGKKALEMIGLREEQTKLTAKIEKVRKELVEQFVKDNQTRIVVDGHVYHIHTSRATRLL